MKHSSPSMERDLADSKAHRAKAKEQLQAKVERLIRDGLPACVVARRAECSDTLVHRVAKQLGLTVVRFADWSES